jgi:hypothetical protein
MHDEAGFTIAGRALDVLIIVGTLVAMLAVIASGWFFGGDPTDRVIAKLGYAAEQLQLEGFAVSVPENAIRLAFDPEGGEVTGTIELTTIAEQPGCTIESVIERTLTGHYDFAEEFMEGEYTEERTVDVEGCTGTEPALAPVDGDWIAFVEPESGLIHGSTRSGDGVGVPIDFFGGADPWAGPAEEPQDFSLGFWQWVILVGALASGGTGLMLSRRRGGGGDVEPSPDLPADASPGPEWGDDVLGEPERIGDEPGREPRRPPADPDLLEDDDWNRLDRGDD